MNLLALRNKCKYKGRQTSGSRVNKIIFLTRAIITSEIFRRIAKLSRCKYLQSFGSNSISFLFILAYMYHNHNVNQI